MKVLPYPSPETFLVAPSSGLLLREGYHRPGNLPLAYLDPSTVQLIAGILAQQMRRVIAEVRNRLYTAVAC